MLLDLRRVAQFKQPVIAAKVAQKKRGESPTASPDEQRLSTLKLGEIDVLPFSKQPRARIPDTSTGDLVVRDFHDNARGLSTRSR
jgi:hypothetical protein